jgi:hypothetical protein
MAKEQFLTKRLRTDTLAIIEQANAIIDTYEAQGYQLTLRQLYYQFVARDLIENTERSYKRLGGIINDGRLAGLIDWDAIEDRTRNLQGISHWRDPSQMINSAYQSFRMDKWANQPNRVEVWVEKDALVGVLERVCNRHDVDYFACRGYVSQSEMYTAAKRIERYLDKNQEVTILHLGDHDPSGIDMTRDIIDRLELFMGGLDVDRLALNWEQIEVYNPPPNPAKTTDSRFNGYSTEYGDESWELDALEPAVIDDLIEQHILALRDDNLWAEAVAEEKHHRNLLLKAYLRWDKVAKFLQNGRANTAASGGGE